MKKGTGNGAFLFCHNIVTKLYYINKVRESTQPLKSVYQTGKEMLRLCVDYNDDVSHFDNWSIPKYFDYVKKLSYKRDPDGVEYLSRPKASLRQTGVLYRDCDDKSILIGAFLFRRKIPFRFIGVSTKKDKTLHHVVVEAMLLNKNCILDATYPNNKFLLHGNYTEYKPLIPWVLYGENFNP